MYFTMERQTPIKFNLQRSYSSKREVSKTLGCYPTNFGLLRKKLWSPLRLTLYEVNQLSKSDSFIHWLSNSQNVSLLNPNLVPTLVSQIHEGLQQSSVIIYNRALLALQVN